MSLATPNKPIMVNLDELYLGDSKKNESIRVTKQCQLIVILKY